MAGVYVRENRFLSVAKAAGYLGIWFGVQVWASFPFMIYLLIRAAGEDLDLSNSEKLVELLNGELLSEAMLLTLLADAVTVVMIAAVMAIRRDTPSGRENRALFGKISPLTAVLAVLCGIFLSMVVQFVFSFLPDNVIQQYNDQTSAYGSSPLAVYILAAVIMAPVAEELIFRGMVQTRLRRAMPVWLAVGITAVLFGLVHGNLVQGLYAGFLGIVLGIASERADSILASMLIHFGFNSVSILSYLISYTGWVPGDAFNTVMTVVVYASVPVFAALFFLFWKSTGRGKASAEQAAVVTAAGQGAVNG